MKDEDFVEDDLAEEDSEEETGGLYEHFKINVDAGQEPERIDKYLVRFKQNATRNKISQACRAGNVLVNGKVVKQNYRVKPLDEISIVLSRPPRQNEIIPQNIPINIVYEDEEVAVVDKSAGMVVHPGFGNWDGTLVNALAYHFEQEGQKSDLDRIGLVHRIDKDTSGLLVIAKSEYALSYLAKQFFNKTTKRLYWAFVWGDLKEDEGTISGYIGRHQKDRLQMALYDDETHGKWSVTHYRVIERFRYMTWVECRLETGRTHQIRAHFKHIGHPLFNDARYGGDVILRGVNLPKYKQFIQNLFKIMPRQGLHARSLGFKHPRTKKEVYFESAMPSDMSEVLDRWRNYMENN